jgi:TonB family protein
METFALYLLKSVIWLSGFALVYHLFLRNERFFTLNRFYLLSGILASFLLPLLTIRYSVVLPLADPIPSEVSSVSGVENISGSSGTDTGFLLILLYLSGIIFVGFMLIKQSRPVLRSLRKADIITSSPVKLIRTSDYSGSFSFFSFVFVNPSVTDIEMREIMNHELVHVRQKHWIDLVLGGLLCMLQWFNPLVWIYIRFIRQNHEYLADEVALQRTSDPAVYRATLLNQIAGIPVVSLANSFNYSLSKKRFEMMKNIIISPYRKMKVLLILPVFAIVLYAFAKPEYKYSYSGENYRTGDQAASVQTKEVKGTVADHNGRPLEKAVIVVTGTTTGTTTDAKGHFRFENIPAGGALAVTYVGYKSVVIKPVFTSEMTIRMELDTINAERLINPMAPPPPPPPPPASSEGSDAAQTNPAPAEISKKTEAVKDVFVVVEELPQFPGGPDAMASWIYTSMKYPDEAVKKKIAGKVYVTFLISSSGKIKNAEVKKPVHPLLDAEAKRVISSMPDWKPGTQAGKPVDVNYMVPVEFKLK